MYTEEECISALKEAAEKLNHPPTRKEYKKLDIYPAYETIRDKFGGWDEAREKAGFTDFERKKQYYTEEDCIEALQKAAKQIGLPISMRDYRKTELSPSAQIIKGRFGGWDKAKEEADVVYTKERVLEDFKAAGHKGVSAPEYQDIDEGPPYSRLLSEFGTWTEAKEKAGFIDEHKTRGYTQQDCIEALQKAYEEIQEPLTRSKYDNYGFSPASSTIKNKFEDWWTALDIAGVPRSKMSYNGYTKEDCIEALQEAEKELGRTPSFKEYKNELDIKPSEGTIIKRFGTWKAAKKEAGLEYKKVDFSRGEIIDFILQCYEETNSHPSRDNYKTWKLNKEDSNLIPSVSIIKKEFGTYGDALRSAGIGPKREVEKKHTEEDCIEALKKAKEKLGHSPSVKEYQKLDILPNYGTIQQKVGWKKGKEQAGLEPLSISEAKTLSTKEIKKNFFEVCRRINRIPEKREYHYLKDRITVQTIERQFGSWDEFINEINLPFKQEDTDYSKQECEELVQQCIDEDCITTKEDYLNSSGAIPLSNIEQVIEEDWNTFIKRLKNKEP